jgi:hypothetical protein
MMDRNPATWIMVLGGASETLGPTRPAAAYVVKVVHEAKPDV